MICRSGKGQSKVCPFVMLRWTSRRVWSRASVEVAVSANSIGSEGLGGNRD